MSIALATPPIPMYFIGLYWASIGACLAGAVSAGQFALATRGNGRLWLFTVMGITIAGYQAGVLFSLQARTVEEAFRLNTLGTTFALLWMAAYSVFVAINTRVSNLYRTLSFVLIPIALLITLNLFLASGLRFNGASQLHPITLPWGETVQVLSGPPTVVSVIARLFIYGMYLWFIQRGLVVYREGKRLLGGIIISTSAAIVCTFTITTLSDYGLIHMPYLGGFVYLIVMLLFGVVVSNDIQAARDNIEETNLELMREYVGHKAARNRLEYLAYHDALTGLCNRAALLDFQLEPHLENTPAPCLLLVDLDRFDIFNDTLGHQISDELLREVARRLEDHIWNPALTVRMGSDEFAMIINQYPDGQTPQVFAERVLAKLRKPFQVQDQPLHLTASIGYARAPDDGRTISELLAAADLALREAKRQGRNQARAYSGGMSRAIHDRLKLGNALRTALDQRAFVLHYQPKVRIADGQLLGFEALLRWNHPTEGFIGPDRFIPIAEETQLIVPMGYWVLEEACRTLHEWEAQMPASAPLTMAINVSASQLSQPDFPERVASIVREHGIPPTRIELEITESMLMNEPQECIARLNALKEMGFNISIDDFGTGYSSLSYLKHLPIHVLKIDRAFVREIDRNESDAAICRATIAMADALGLKTVAEGVEMDSQVQQLRKLGCEVAQGFLYARALPKAEALAYLQASNPDQLAND